MARTSIERLPPFEMTGRVDADAGGDDIASSTALMRASIAGFRLMSGAPDVRKVAGYVRATLAT